MRVPNRPCYVATVKALGPTAVEIVADSTSLLSALLGSSADCIKILDLAGNLVFMTEGGMRVMEVTDFEAIRGCPWPDFWHDEGNLQAKAAVAAALDGRVGHFQGFATTMAGTPKWWDVTVTLIRDAAGQPDRLLSVSRDITDTRLADEALRESEARFKMFAQAMPNQVWSATPDGQLDWFNEQAYAYSGLTFDDVSGTKWIGIVHAEDIAGAAENWTAALSTGEPYQAEFRLRKADGTYRWHLARALPIKDDTGRIMRWIGTNTEIEGQKAIEAELMESQQRVEAAISAADIGTWDLDPQTGVLKWDRRCYELFGLTEGKPVTFDVFLAGVHPQDRDATEQACLAAMRPDNPDPYDIEYRTIGLDDGIERWVSAKGKAILENGAAARFIGTIRDVSKLKRAEAQQKLLTGELEHRMKNMMAMVAAIARQTFRSAATKEEARTIFDARLHALNYAHNILTQTSWTSAPMTTVVEGALAPHRSGEKRVHVTGPAVDLTAKQALSLALALHELATNAAKYGALSTSGGTIEVTWACTQEADDTILRFCWREAGGPKVTPPSTRGFGSRLIESTLSSDFGDKVKLEFLPEGVVCRFETKLSDLTERPE